MNYISYYNSPVGKLTLVSNEAKLIGLFLEGQKFYMRTIQGDCIEEETDIHILVKNWLSSYFKGENPTLSVPLAPSGTPFQLSVWEILLKIPYGSTCSYKDIANTIAKNRGLSSMSSQAIGSAVGHNPISILIPCHRVVGSDGSLTGYAGGVNRKMALLELEGIQISRKGSDLS
ncbi:MAG: methylated-DNA--[protein]-cysteine S-methyltransferase [Firmicutes bacterium]|nr:methylated-DNA--[protein]-cysteine S-methyltransferase [Bacillota bacterium]